jgi:hypothetical protein
MPYALFDMHWEWVKHRAGLKESFKGIVISRLVLLPLYVCLALVCCLLPLPLLPPFASLIASYLLCLSFLTQCVRRARGRRGHTFHSIKLGRVVVECLPESLQCPGHTPHQLARCRGHCAGMIAVNASFFLCNPFGALQASARTNEMVVWSLLTCVACCLWTTGKHLRGW